MSTHTGGQASAVRVELFLPLGNSTRHREAKHIRSLAPSRFPTVLAMEIAIGGAPAEHRITKTSILGGLHHDYPLEKEVA